MPKTFSALPQVNKYLQTLKDKVETLTNKTLTSPVLNTATIVSPTLTGGTSTHKYVVTEVAADGAITISPGVVAITKTSAAAVSVAAPSEAQDGTVMTITSMTDFAHVITFTGSKFIKGAATAYNTVTFDAYKGASVRVIACNGYWVQNAANSVTPSAV